MKKNIVVQIRIDGIELVDLEKVIDDIEKSLEEYEDKRIDIRIQDTPLVVRR